MDSRPRDLKQESRQILENDPLARRELSSKKSSEKVLVELDRSIEDTLPLHQRQRIHAIAVEVKHVQGDWKLDVRRVNDHHPVGQSAGVSWGEDGQVRQRPKHVTL